MDTYIVQDATISRIVNWVKQDSRHSSFMADGLRRLGYRTPRLGWGVKVDINWPEKLASDLFKLNRRAIITQHGLAFSRLRFRFKYDPLEAADSVQTLKSLYCLQRQCREGVNPGDPLYHWLVELGHHLAYTIVISLPEYKKAKWG